MHCTRIAGLAACLVLVANLAPAQDELLDEPRQLEQVSFSPPTSASIRLTNGVRRTGKIVSISRESMVYQVGRDNKEVTVEIDDIQRVNTLDNEFAYEPAKEDFERLKIKARRLSYLRVETVQTYVPPPEGFREPDPPADDNSPPVVPVSQPTVPDPETTTPAETTPDTSEPAEQPSVAEIPDDEPQPGQLILFCGNCQGRLPLSVKNGDECPHCGLEFYNASGGGAQSRTGTSAGGGAGRNPNAGPAAYPEVPANQVGGGNGAAPAAGDATTGGGQISARGFDLSQVPVWVQVGFFVCILVIGWLVLQRR